MVKVHIDGNIFLIKVVDEPLTGCSIVTKDFIKIDMKNQSMEYMRTILRRKEACICHQRINGKRKIKGNCRLSIEKEDEFYDTFDAMVHSL